MTRASFDRWFLLWALCAGSLLWPINVPAAGRPSPAASGSPTQAAQTEPRPSIQLAEPTHDFGEAMEGTEVTHSFVVKNSGDGELRIEQVRPG